MTIPAGFEPMLSDSPFVNLVGPFYYKEEPQCICIGVVIERKHCNSSGRVHGGLIATMTDLILGANVGIACTPADVLQKFKRDGITPDPQTLPALVTVNLVVDFLGTAAIGDWLESRAQVHRTGNILSTASASMTCADVQVVRANGTFRNFNKLKHVHSD